MLWELFGTPRRYLGLVWDPFGKVFLGVFQRRNSVGTCLGYVFGMCLGHVCDIFPLYGISQISGVVGPFPKLMVLGNGLGHVWDLFWESAFGRFFRDIQMLGHV